MKAPLLVGIDVGTSCCKVKVVDANGALIGSAEATYTIHYTKPGWAQQWPEDWYQAACYAIRKCIASAHVDPRQIAGLSVDGTAHNVAFIGEGDRIIYPTIHWSDLRSVDQANWLDTHYGQMIYDVTYQRPNPSYTLAQLLWLKDNEPHIWSRLRYILVTKDYVRHRLVGDYNTDAYDAIGTQLYDARNKSWSDKICNIIGLSTDRLPKVLSPESIAGHLLPTAAQDTGLVPGIPVAIGSGDSVVEAFGVGIVEPGQTIVKLASAGNVNVVTSEPRPSIQTITYPHVVKGRWFSIAATNSGTTTLRWFRDTFHLTDVSMSDLETSNSFDFIEQVASNVPIGCEGLIFHPYLMGERSPYWDAQLRGDFVGVSARHRISHFTRAVLEGVAFSIRDCLEIIEDLGETITNICIMGGGTNSRLWCQILCDVLGRPLWRPNIKDAAYGAALLAGVAVRLFDDWQKIPRNALKIEIEFIPDKVAHRLYSEYFDVYRAITRDLARHNHRLTELANALN